MTDPLEQEEIKDHRDLFWYGAIALAAIASVALMYRSFTDEDTFYRAEIIQTGTPLTESAAQPSE